MGFLQAFGVIKPSQAHALNLMGIEGMNITRLNDELNQNLALKNVLFPAGDQRSEADKIAEMNQYPDLFRTMGQLITEPTGRGDNRRVIINNSIIDRLNQDIIRDSSLGELLRETAKSNPNEVTQLLQRYNAGGISLKDGLTEIRSSVPTAQANPTTATTTPSPSTPVSPAVTAASPQQPSTPPTNPQTTQPQTNNNSPAPATAPESHQLPERITDQNRDEFFNNVGLVVYGISAEVFPNDNRLSGLADKFENPDFRRDFENRYNADPKMRETYQRLIDMVAENAEKSEEMDQRARNALRPHIGQILDEPEKLHNAEFLGRVDNLLDMADNPMMGFMGMIMDAVKGFFGSFMGGLGITGPDVLNRMFSDGKNMVMDGLSQLPFIGQFFAGNANGENIRGLERSLREQDLGQHYSVVRNSAGAPQEYVFVDVRTRDDKGTGFMIRDDPNIPDSLQRRNNMYFDSMDREGRGDNERVWRDGTVAIPKEIYDQVKDNPEQLQARITEAQTIRQSELDRLKEQEEAAERERAAAAERARQEAEARNRPANQTTGGQTADPNAAVANGMSPPR